MDEGKVRTIVEAFGYQPTAVAAPLKGYRNSSYKVGLADGTPLNLILYKAEPNILSTIRRANRIGNYLYEHGIPSRRTVEKRILQLHPSRPLYAALYEYLPGHTIAWEAYTMKHLKALGQTMAVMHQGLKTYPGARHLPSQPDLLRRLVATMEQYFEEEGVQAAMHRKLGLRFQPRKLQRLLDTIDWCERHLPAQALHMDFVRGNVLFEDQPQLRVSGVIDFEKAAHGTVLFDLARTLAFLLVDCKYKSEEAVRKYFLTSGYQRHGQANLTKTHVRLLEPLIDLFLLHDFYKFLLHNPYEYLHQNEHYVRTVEQLRRRGIVAEST